jgi:hypothetical protein
MMRRPLVPSVALLLAMSCSGAPTTTTTTPPAPATTSAPATETASPSPEPSLSPVPEPGEMPSGYDADDEPSAVPADALIPAGATPTGEWFAFTDRGVLIVVAWMEPGTDVELVPRGVAIWRRAAGAPHWRPAFVRRHDASEGVTEIQVTTADVTADRSDDVLVFEGAGGTGGCGTWLVIEPGSMRRIYGKDLCDGRVEPAPPAEPGLLLTASVFRPGDAHCCPSAMRTTRLVWEGGRWKVVERSVAEA